MIPEQTPLPPEVGERVLSYARASVAEIRREVFPLHGLSPST